MTTVNIDSKLLEALQLSTCFGIAHDDNTPECKQCDVKSQCKIKSEGALNIPTPTAKPKTESKMADKPKAEPKPASKPKAEVKSQAKSTAQKNAPKTQVTKPKPTTNAPSGDMPDFKPMTLEELKALASERKVDWKDYGNDQITRMRLIMSLKKSY